MRLFLIGFLFAFAAHAKVEVAFVVLKDAEGKVIQFEQGGQFGHVAVSYKNQWLHAHPLNGVELTDHLNDMGWTAVILESEEWHEPSEAYVEATLGKAFSYRMPWENAKYTYCAKLLAESYQIKPKPMNFAGERWQKVASLPRGKPGLSADDLYQYFLSRGFKVKQTFKDLESTPAQRFMHQAK